MTDKPFAYFDAEYDSIVIAGRYLDAEPSMKSAAAAINAAVSAIVAAARKEEREAMKERCAKECDGRGRLLRMNGMIFRAEEADTLAAAIRALGE